MAEQPEDDSGRKLVAEGYCHSAGWDESTLVMRIWDDGQWSTEEMWTVDTEKCPDDMQDGSYMRLYENCPLEIFAPVWTAEEIAQIKEDIKKFDAFFDLPDDSVKKIDP